MPSYLTHAFMKKTPLKESFSPTNILHCTNMNKMRDKFHNGDWLNYTLLSPDELKYDVINLKYFFVSSSTASYLPWPTLWTSSSTRTVSWLLTRSSHKFVKKWRDLSSRSWTMHSRNFPPTIFSKNFQLQRARAQVRDLYPKFDPGAFSLEDAKKIPNTEPFSFTENKVIENWNYIQKLLNFLACSRIEWPLTGHQIVYWGTKLDLFVSIQ